MSPQLPLTPRRRLLLQWIAAAFCVIAGLEYPFFCTIARIETFGQISDRGGAYDPILYNPPTFATLATLVLLPIGVIVGFVTAAEVTAYSRRSRPKR